MHSIIMTMLQLEIPGNIIAFVDAGNDFLPKCTTVACLVSAWEAMHVCLEN